jgi:mediator of RNA polymerase II transcription subunit 13
MAAAKRHHPLLAAFEVDLNPPHQLATSPASLNPSNFIPPFATYTTPVATPLPNILSPDQFGNAVATPGSTGANAATPTADAEPEGPEKVVDVTDEVWAVMLSHSACEAYNNKALRPYLAKGYLVKRSGPKDTDKAIVLGVGLQYAPGVESWVHDQFLKRCLAKYRDLGTLARYKALEDKENGILPWHISVAARAAGALSGL